MVSHGIAKRPPSPAAVGEGEPHQGANTYALMSSSLRLDLEIRLSASIGTRSWQGCEQAGTRVSD